MINILIGVEEKSKKLKKILVEARAIIEWLNSADEETILHIQNISLVNECIDFNIFHPEIVEEVGAGRIQVGEE